MPTANIKAKSGEEVNRFPRTEARVTSADMVRPPKDRMMRMERHKTATAFRELAGKSSAAALDHLRD